MVINIKNLVKRYGTHVALDHLDLQVEQGSVLGLLGPNGAGKTTLVSVLNGLSSFQEGEIEIFGLSLKKHLPAIRRRSAVIPQTLALYENLTVGENLRFFAGIQKIDGQKSAHRIERAVRVNHLQSMLDNRAGELSGGQQQRLNIAIGLLNDPELLYFDEPTAGIDPGLRGEILDSIAALADAGRTIVYTSHYLEEIEKICDQAAIIHRGKIIRQGTLASLLAPENHKTAVVKLAVAPGNRVLSSLKQLAFVAEAGHTTLMVAEAGSANMATLLSLLERENIAVRTIRYDAGGLEALFLQLTAEGGEDV